MVLAVRPWFRTEPSEDSAATGVNGDQLDNSAINCGAVYVYRAQ